MCDDINSIVPHYKTESDILWLAVDPKIMSPDGTKLLFGFCRVSRNRATKVELFALFLALCFIWHKHSHEQTSG